MTESVAPPSGVAIVTGGSRGIGAATALALAEAGLDLCLGYVQDENAALAVRDRCRGSGRSVDAVRADVSVEADVIRLFEAADGLGPVTVLVNNAALVLPANRVDELDVAELRHLLEVNLVGPFTCAREAVRRMSHRHGGDGGCIVNVSSVGARHGAPGEHVDYAASKGGLESMTVGLAREVAAEGVRVNGVRPGAVDTAIQGEAGDSDRIARRTAETPLGRIASPEEIASVIAWLCSPAASFMVGSIIDVTGGR